jgi:hypothetical protein
MQFPYEKYEILAGPTPLYYPRGEGEFARWVASRLQKASAALADVYGRRQPDLEVLVVGPQEWECVPHSEVEEVANPHPYWTDVTSPPTIVVPIEMDAIFGEITPEMLAFMLYHEIALALFEDDPRPWPEESPLWADEWQFKFAALWLSQQLDHVEGVVNKDLREQYADLFEPEVDGKTPVTVRGFDWDEDTTAEDYLCYELLLEQFAADLLTKSDVQLLRRFQELYRRERDVMLSDDVTAMLVRALGADWEDWLEGLVYF